MPKTRGETPRMNSIAGKENEVNVYPIGLPGLLNVLARVFIAVAYPSHACHAVILRSARARASHAVNVPVSNQRGALPGSRGDQARRA